MNEGDLVKVIDKNKVKKDEFLEEHALKIIQASDYKGEITKVDEEIHFVGFKNELGWVTQGYKSDEIEVI